MHEKWTLLLSLQSLTTRVFALFRIDITFSTFMWQRVLTVCYVALLLEDHIMQWCPPSIRPSVRLFVPFRPISPERKIVKTRFETRLRNIKYSSRALWHSERSNFKEIRAHQLIELAMIIISDMNFVAVMLLFMRFYPIRLYRKPDASVSIANRRLIAAVTTAIWLRFDGRWTVYQRSFRPQWRNTSVAADPLAAVTCGVTWRDHVTSLLQRLHWLSVPERAEFKTLVVWSTGVCTDWDKNILSSDFTPVASESG